MLYPRRWAASLVVVLSLLIGASIDARQKQIHVPLTDEQIRQHVEHKLIERDIAHVTVTVADQMVTLRGTVPSLWAKREAADEALEVSDVREVANELEIARAESDAAIAEDVRRNVLRYVFYTIYDDIDLNVENGVVVLSGRVTMPYKADEIAELASRVKGVQEVRNTIRTLPTSIFDDELRYAIARRIYRDPLFWNYAIQVNPPIHIIVENSRVTLTGAVASEVERRKAEVIVRSSFGVLAVENKLRINP